jgi:hypothetical protein
LEPRSRTGSFGENSNNLKNSKNSIQADENSENFFSSQEVEIPPLREEEPVENSLKILQNISHLRATSSADKFQVEETLFKDHSENDNNNDPNSDVYYHHSKMLQENLHTFIAQESENKIQGNTFVLL